MIRGRQRWARLARIRIDGEPPVKKNGQKIARRGKNGPSFLLPNPNYTAWLQGALYQIKSAWRRAGHTQPIGSEHERVWLCMHFVLVDSASDQSNLYEAVQDALQEAGVLTNDYWIASHDGSDRVRGARAYVEVQVMACAQ